MDNTKITLKKFTAVVSLPLDLEQEQRGQMNRFLKLQERIVKREKQRLMDQFEATVWGSEPR